MEIGSRDLFGFFVNTKYFSNLIACLGAGTLITLRRNETSFSFEGKVSGTGRSTHFSGNIYIELRSIISLVKVAKKVSKL
jgi:hypothetical protein